MKFENLIINKDILITSDADFVGSNLAKRLYDYENTVYVIDELI